MLLLFLACTAKGPDSGLDTDTGNACFGPGVYGDPSWSLDVSQDCSAVLLGYCGDGPIAPMRADADGAFAADLTWTWQGAGPSGGSDPATFVGTLSAGVVDGTLSWGSTSQAVHAVLGTAPGTGLGVGNCPLD